MRCLDCELIISSQPFWNNAPTFFKSFNLKPYIIRSFETHTRKTCLASIFPAKISSGILGLIYTSIFGGRFCIKLVRFQEHYYNSLYKKSVFVQNKSSLLLKIILLNVFSIFTAKGHTLLSISEIQRLHFHS